MSSQLKRAASDSESESESESDEEETKSKVTSKQQEQPKQQVKQQDEAESESEPDTASDSEPESRFNVGKRDTNSKVASKGPDNIQGKRGRDVNGAKGAPAEEPTSKKRKGAKDDKARSQPEKNSSPVKVSSPAKKVEKAEPALRGTKATAAGSKSEKAKASAAKVENARPPAGSRKRKASPPPPPASARLQAQVVEVEKSSPVKPKKIATWTNAVEESLVNQLHRDHSNGLVLPNTKGDPYWEKLLKRLQLERDMTELQLCDKVRRMKSRYLILKERPKGEGAKLFKSSHEEKIFQFWADIWGPGTKTSQPAPEEDDSEDDSGDTTTAPGQVIKTAAAQVKGGDSSSDDENEEEETEDVKQKTAGLNQVDADVKALPEPPVVSPFISKPRLAFTPLVPKERNLSKRVEEEVVATVEEHPDDLVAKDDGKKGDVVSLANEHLKWMRDETLAFFQELRGSCFQAMEEQRNGSLTGGLGNVAFAGKGFGFPGMIEGFKTGGGSQAGMNLQKKWREHKIQELALLSERLQLLQEQCRLQIKELKQQDQ